MSSTGISITIPRSRSGAVAAISSAVLAPSEVPITTASLDLQVVHQRHHLLAEGLHRVAPHVARAIGFAVAEQVDRDHAVARAARPSASGRCIFWESSSPWTRITGRFVAAPRRAVLPRVPSPGQAPPARRRTRCRRCADLRTGRRPPLKPTGRPRVRRTVKPRAKAPGWVHCRARAVPAARRAVPTPPDPPSRVQQEVYADPGEAVDRPGPVPSPGPSA